MSAEHRRSDDPNGSDFTALRWMPKPWRKRVYLACAVGAGLATFVGWLYKGQTERVSRVVETQVTTSATQSELIAGQVALRNQLEELKLKMKTDAQEFQAQNRQLQTSVNNLSKALDAYDEIASSRHGEVMKFLMDQDRGKGKRRRVNDE